MSQQPMTPKESLDVISQIITEAKQRQEENGLVYIFWGLLIAIVSLLSFILQYQEMYHLVFVPYLIIPFGGIWSYFYYRNKGKTGGTNMVGRILSIVWTIASVNMMILGFFFSGELGPHLTPMILILLGSALAVSGVALKYQPLLFAGLFGNLAALGAFLLPSLYHPLVMAAVSIVSVLIPGILLRQADQRRKAHV